MLLSKSLYCTRAILTMELKEVVKKLNEFAPTSLAEKWDNVGLLVEPSSPLKVEKILMTNDLTPPVMEEAISLGVNLIISYHPPIFTGMKCVTQKTWKERIVTACLENRIGVFSPHTSYDCVKGGVNDWLIQAFDVSNVKPVQDAMCYHSNLSHSISCTVSNSQCSDLQQELSPIANVGQSFVLENADSRFLNVACTQGNLPNVVSTMNRYHGQCIEVKQLSKIPKTGYGMGRKGSFTTKITLEEAIKKVKGYLGLEHIRVARSEGSNTLETVAVCAGSGGSLLKNVPASLYLTGEMSHHDVLHAVYNGTSVILCDHSNTERGFFKHLKQKLEVLLPGVNLCISTVDKDPLEIV